MGIRAVQDNRAVEDGGIASGPADPVTAFYAAVFDGSLHRTATVPTSCDVGYRYFVGFADFRLRKGAKD